VHCEYLLVPVAELLFAKPCPVPDLMRVNMLVDPMLELLLWEDFLPS
jgi:hypothetical protein